MPNARSMWSFSRRARAMNRCANGSRDCPKRRQSVGADILTVQHAWPVGKPLVDNLGEGIWEIRSRLANRIARALFAVIDEEIVLLHGFIKKQQQTPQQELALAKQRKREYLQTL